LKNVRCSVFLPGKKKPLFAESGEMMFIRGGVTGPLILTSSRYVTDKLEQTPRISIDLKPALDAGTLDTRIQRDFSENINKDFGNAEDKLLPRRMVETIVMLSDIDPGKKVHTVTRKERLRLVSLLKDLQLTPVSTAGFGEAVITVGGVSVNEIDPSAMMSKIIPGLFFAGEVIDVDALTGGYNLQIAFSTGFLAGKNAAGYIKE
jgi:predicted Rossmann fold flavoprotein